MPNVTYIDQFITDGKKDIVRADNLVDSYLVSDPEHSSIYRSAWDDFFIQHDEELRENLILCRIDKRQYYRPKWVSLQIYGTTELWLSLLRANKMKSVIEFHWPLISVYSPLTLKRLIDVYFKRENKG